MKYKYPKKLLVGSTKFKVIYDYKWDGGAEFSYPIEGKKAFIRFGMANHKRNKGEFLELLIHELKEMIQIEQSTRLFNVGNNSYEFHYSHMQHQDLCSRLAGLLAQFIK